MSGTMIDFYQFGEIVIEGKVYTSDVIVSPSGVKSDWRRKVGHRLAIDDLKEVMGQEPEVLVVGTGSWGAMEVPPETRRYVESQGTELIAENTEKACNTYNRLCSSCRVVAILHLTC